MRRAAAVSLSLLLAIAGARQAAAADHLWNLPAWVPAPRVPADNPMSAKKVELGRHLFYDTRLSVTQGMSCASCHEQAKAFTDGRPVALGAHGERGLRSAMTLTNVAYLPVLTWANPNLTRLEQQVLVPLFGERPVEMGMSGKETELFARLGADAAYVELFLDSFPTEHGAINLSTVTKALAAFQRSLLSFDSPYDRYKYGGQPQALSAAAKRGEELFFGEELECSHCHGGFSFTDNVRHSRLAFDEIGFHNTGLYNLDGKGAYPDDNHGIREVTGELRDEGKFRSPSLRNVAVTAPYMHDGSIPTLRNVILEHYAQQGKAVHDGKPASPLRSNLIAGFELTAAQVDDVIAFLESLTDSSFLSNPQHANPFAVNE